VSEEKPQPLVPPAWLIAAVDQRLALMEEAIGETVAEGIEMFHALTGYRPGEDVDVVSKVMAGDIMMTPLTEPREGASKEELDRWERSCDNCGTWCPDGQLFFTGQMVRDFHGSQVIIIFGMCPLCKDTP